MTLSITFWTIYFKKKVAQNCMDKLKVFPWVLIMLLLLKICFYFVMRRADFLALILWCLTVSLSLSHWYHGSGVVLDCIDP